MIPERRNEKEESDSVLWMEKKAGDDKVLGVGKACWSLSHHSFCVPEGGGAGSQALEASSALFLVPDQ